MWLWDCAAPQVGAQRNPNATCGVMNALRPSFWTAQSLFTEVSMSPKKDTQKSAKSATASNKESKGFTEEERAAMRERAKELKAEARAMKDKADGESDVLAKIAEMPEPDRAMAKGLPAVIK